MQFRESERPPRDDTVSTRRADRIEMPTIVLVWLLAALLVGSAICMWVAARWHWGGHSEGTEGGAFYLGGLLTTIGAWVAFEWVLFDHLPKIRRAKAANVPLSERLAAMREAFRRPALLTIVGTTVAYLLGGEAMRSLADSGEARFAVILLLAALFRYVPEAATLTVIRRWSEATAVNRIASTSDSLGGHS